MLLQPERFGMHISKALASVLLVASSVTTACASQQVSQFADSPRQLVLEDYFLGETAAYGVFEDRFGKVRRQFKVDITGTLDGDRLTLTEKFKYDDGERDTRVWEIDVLGGGAYRGTAGDVPGLAEGQVSGNAFNWKYKVDLKVGDSIWNVGFDDWTHYLPCDSAIAVQTASVRPPVPYTRAIAHDAGWQWRIPLQHRQGNGIVYCSRYLDREAALDKLLSSVEGDCLTEPNFIRFTTGARRKQWHRNCIAVGLSGGFMEPLESTSIHLIQRAILRLIRMLPMGDISERDVAEFNDQQQTDMLQIRDFLILHYKATDRRDSAFWRQCADMEIPDSLAQKIELFRETGRVFRKNEELFVENSWIQVMMGQGIMPQSYHPIATKLSGDELDNLLTGLRENVAKTVAGLPAHRDYVAQYCGSEESLVS